MLEYRPKWFDLPLLGWIVWQLPSSIANGHGLHDGTAQALDFASTRAVPYFLRRCYFTRPRAIREVALALVGAGLIYVPLCPFEMRMSPTLDLWTYGSYPSPFFDMVRLGGYWRSELEERVKQLAVRNVTFRGSVEHDKIPSIIEAHHVLGFPNIKEFGGGVILEVMAMGCVPVTVNYGGVGELVTPQVGFAVPLTDRRAIVRGLLELAAEKRTGR